MSKLSVIVVSLALTGFLVSVVVVSVTANRDYGSRSIGVGGGIMDHDEEDEDEFHHSFHHEEDDHHDTAFHTVGLEHPDHLPSQGVCEPIKIVLCMELGYNQTTMPNLVGHDAQADADALLQTFSPLIQYGCSAHLKLFLCSAYVPMCTDKVPQPIGPCRSLCESVQLSCEPILKEFGFSWPPSLNCSKFHPENNHQHMCIPGQAEDEQYNAFGTGGGSPFPGRGGSFSGQHHRHSESPTFTTLPRDRPKVITTASGGNDRHINPSVPRRPIVLTPSSPNSGHGHGGVVVPNMDLPFPYSQHHFTNEKVNSILHKQQQQSTSGQTTGIGLVKKDSKNHHQHHQQQQCIGPRRIWSKGGCWIKCPAVDTDSAALGIGHGDGIGNSKALANLFQPSEISFARNYVLLWASLSLSTALIALTLSICSPKLNTAERPILYIALCQVLFSIGIIIGSTIPFACFNDPTVETTELLAGSGMMVPSSCAVVFLLTYFFGTAATLWWVLLCLSWLLSISRRLSASLEQKEWPIFHLVSWGIASFLTSAALILKKVDVDELTGLCGVGYQNIDALTFYNLIPLNICLSLGFLFLLIGILLRHFTRQPHILCLDKLKPRPHTNGCNNTHPGPGIGCCAITAASLGPPTNCDHHFHHHLHTHRQSSIRAPQGYTPVLLTNGSSSCSNSHHHHHCTLAATTSNGLQLQRIKALQNSKSVWMRVGIFALVHSLPIACQVGTMAYELSGREAWEAGRERPNIQIFLLRLNMSLIAGLTTGVWVLSTYSWKSLSSLAQRFCSCLVLFSSTSKHKNQQSNINNSSNSNSNKPSSTLISSSVIDNTSAAATVPLVPSTTISSHLQSSSFPPSSSTHNTVLSTFQSQPQSINNNNINSSSSVRHKKSVGRYHHRHIHNHPLPPIPPVRNAAGTAVDHPRTDIWRRGETIL